eukprot:3933053-Rhodomonas_salina.2
MLECEVKKVEMFTPQSQVKKPRHVELLGEQNTPSISPSSTEVCGVLPQANGSQCRKGSQHNLGQESDRLGIHLRQSTSLPSCINRKHWGGELRPSSWTKDEKQTGSTPTICSGTHIPTAPARTKPLTQLHSATEVAPGSETSLVGQASHAVAADSAANFPSSHSIHSDDPLTALYLPATHAVQVPPSSPLDPAWQKQLETSRLPRRLLECGVGQPKQNVPPVKF